MCKSKKQSRKAGNVSYTILVERHRKYYGTAYSLCLCECGKEFLCPRSKAIRGQRKYCSDCHKTARVKNAVKHGMSSHRIYNIYIHLLQRVYNPNHTSYPYLGGKGVGVAPVWLAKDGFQQFFEFASSQGITSEIDGRKLARKDKNGDFSPENCYFTEPVKARKSKRK